MGLALLAIATLGIQEPTLPTTDARLVAVLSRPAKVGMMPELERLATEGVPGADPMFRGFSALLSGSDGPDWTAACRIWESASRESAEAAHFAAECEEHGHDRPADLERAAELYGLAGEGGFPKSLCALGNLYLNGRGVPANAERAVDLCRRGAEMGDADAQTDLGNFHLRGQGTAQNYVEARHWFGLAALQGQRNALLTLGIMDLNGDGGERSPEKALQRFEAAYAAGRPEAAALAGRAALILAVPNAPSGPVDTEQLAVAKRWFLIAVEEDPTDESRARSAVTLAQISGYEALARQQTDSE